MFRESCANHQEYKILARQPPVQVVCRFITADFLYMFRASCANHQEYKILTRQPPVQVVCRFITADFLYMFRACANHQEYKILTRQPPVHVVCRFITADFLYMFRASCANHQEYKILTLQPPVQVVMVAGRSSLRHTRAKWWSTCNHNYLYLWLPCQYFILLMMGAWRPKHVEKVCSNKICILLHHVGVLFNLILWCTETQN